MDHTRTPRRSARFTLLSSARPTARPIAGQPRCTQLAGLVLAACLVASGCSSSDTEKGSDIEGLKLDTLDVVAIQEEPLEIGEFLATSDKAMRAWTNLTNTANTPAERTQARQLEDFLRNETTNRQSELINQLETGALYNRMRAASALGFTDGNALSPLLAALSDPETDVVHNALLGLALLGDPDTPLDSLCRLLGSELDPHVRSNAVYAIRTVIEAGGSGSCAVPSARRGLLDSEPLVQVQAALILGLSADTESIEALTDQAYSDTPLVARAAVQALGLIAKQDPTQKGTIARALIPATEKAPRKNRAHAKLALIQLAGADHGEYEDWVKWARGLPD